MTNKSLKFRLMSGLCLVALFVWLISTFMAWKVAKKEAYEVFDAQQVLFAERLATSDLQNILLGNTAFNRGGFKPLKRKYDDDALAFAIFSKKGGRLLSDGDNGDRFIFSDKEGFASAYIENDDDKWRIYWLPVAQGELRIAVGQEIEYREELVNKMVFGQTAIWFGSLPILLAVIFYLIHQALKPINQLSREVLARKPGDISLLDSSDVPTEILPLVKNLNQFFDRTSVMLKRERRFTSDAAHELRSPLTALRIQTEVAQLAGEDNALREQALANLTQGIDRAGQLIEQLLTLSRLDNLKELEELQPVKWQAIIPSLISELYSYAQKRHIDLSFKEQSVPLEKKGQPILASLMLRNLIDNAIKYAKSGASVNIILSKNHIIVEDNGGGVSESDLARLGQRFYRPAGQNEKGSGLGLSIVFRIAELHHYKVRLENVVEEGNIIGFRAIIQL
ncbi:quorum sensing histidine kinase QseC [Rodentibacter trehalosifermentans]|uniref:quorum sensing histidine kinase QseC n=1 Tax=Rodentibacter trehalosifermentans TaxID=1908263 RepID=UPI000984DB97|nr:quorum sensing histidine kinase QseC [Rodentibacter trehalosifermentans]OOF48371.1 two-component system sensor histidine kinase QseC [Rodentibacter trehalosifermentans]